MSGVNSKSSDSNKYSGRIYENSGVKIKIVFMDGFVWLFAFIGRNARLWLGATPNAITNTGHH